VAGNELQQADGLGLELGHPLLPLAIGKGDHSSGSNNSQSSSPLFVPYISVQAKGGLTGNAVTNNNSCGGGHVFANHMHNKSQSPTAAPVINLMFPGPQPQPAPGAGSDKPEVGAKRQRRGSGGSQLKIPGTHMPAGNSFDNVRSQVQLL
jgi:hypothetical protein